MAKICIAMHYGIYQGLSEATTFFNTAKIYKLNLMSLQISQEWLAYHLTTIFDNWNCESKKGDQVTS